MLGARPLLLDARAQFMDREKLPVLGEGMEHLGLAYRDALALPPPTRCPCATSTRRCVLVYVLLA